MRCRSLHFLKNIDGVDFFSFKPSILHLYLDCYLPHQSPPYYNRFPHKIRMLLQLRRGYDVIYMQKSGKFVGHLVVSYGGGLIAGCDENDIAIGPIWVPEEFRKNGLATCGIKAILHSLDIKYKNAYEFIANDNFASIRAAEKSGFSFVGKAKEYSFFKRIIKDDNGSWLLFQFNGNDR